MYLWSICHSDLYLNSLVVFTELITCRHLKNKKVSVTRATMTLSGRQLAIVIVILVVIF